MARLLIAAMGAILLMSAGRPVAAQEPANLDTLVPELRQGGFVIYFRHAATVRASDSDEQPDLDRCETQRNLSAKGREQATQIGAAFRSLEIPVGTVLSSPFCRCKDTAQLAFGHFTVDEDLYFAIGVTAAQTEHLADELRRMLSTPPEAGTNTVIVSHTANLREAAGIWPKPEGVAYVFRPLNEGRFDAIGPVMPDQWASHAAAE